MLTDNKKIKTFLFLSFCRCEMAGVFRLLQSPLEYLCGTTLSVSSLAHAEEMSTRKAQAIRKAR